MHLNICKVMVRGSGLARGGGRWGRFAPGGTFWGGGKIDVIPKNQNRGCKKKVGKKMGVGQKNF